MVEGQELLKVTVSLHCCFSSDISPLTLVSEFIFDLGQKFSRLTGINESISAHKHICFCNVNVSWKQICHVRSFKNCGFMCRWLISQRPWLCLDVWGGRDTAHRWSDRYVCMCVCVCAFLCFCRVKQIVLFVCTVMDITSSLQADALHQRRRSKRILVGGGEFQLAAASSL